MKSDVEKEAGALLLKDYGQFFREQYQDFVGICNGWEHNKTYHPIEILFTTEEHVPIIDLVSSDNILMSKILGVLSSLCVEILELKKEAYERHFTFLSVYDECHNSNIGTHMDALCRVAAFITRCEDVLLNICNQIFALYTDGFCVNLCNIQLHYIINHIGEIFTLLVISELLIFSTSLSKNWRRFCKNLSTFCHTPEKLDLTTEKMSAITRAVENIESKIMSENIVHNALNNILTLRAKLVEKSCSAITTEFSNYVKLAIATLDKKLQENPNKNLLQKCIKINSLFVLNSILFGTNEKKNFKALMELNIKAHSIPVAGTVLWYPEQFLQRYVPSLCTNYGKVPQAMLKTRQGYITSKKSSMTRDECQFQNMKTEWVLTVEENFNENTSQLSASDMSRHAKILLRGLEISSFINNYLTTVINLHLALGVPLSKSLLISIFRINEVLKSIKEAVTRNRNTILLSCNMIAQHLLFQTSSSLNLVKKNLISDKNYASQRLDELTCIVIAEKALKGAVTTKRIIVANVALSLLPSTTYPEDSYAKLGTLLENIETISNFFSLIDKDCNGSWLFWHKDVISIYLEQNFAMNLDVIRLKYLLNTAEDCCVMLHKLDKQFKSNMCETFIDKMRTEIDENVMKSTCQQIETNLRLHIHSHLQLDVVNPFTTNMIKKSLIMIDNFRLVQYLLAVVPTAEHYLSTMYYNLTTVVLSDWKTYGEMRQMAKFKFGLKTVDDNLPTQTLEQGLDVLEIMRNIHIFVSRYLYNLNNQIFIEKSSNNKHLNSINIRHVANSIRTHGTGIMNTTVNFTYQFLRKKFYTFSQFMYDEHIKSRLIKDLRNFRDNTESKMYSYKNAEKFNKGIRNLGLAEDGQSYLDLFRDLISQIGNAMGYVRMIRSGGRHCCADATVFLSSLDKSSFKELCEGLSLVTIESAENLDNDIDILTTNFTQGTEYFKLLVDVFAPIFRNPKNIHLKNFFVIVPPLTLNFVEHLISAKDKMTKKNKDGAAFTDDGFAMGVAYILKLLDQDSDLDSLHWFESIWKHIANERKVLEEQKAKGSVQLQQALALTDKKLHTLEQEFRLLYYSLTSARIFFQ